MRILAVSDVESKYYYEFYSSGKLKGFDLILACGDLKPDRYGSLPGKPLAKSPARHQSPLPPG